MGESVPVWSNQKKRDEARTRQKDQQKQKKRANFSIHKLERFDGGQNPE